MVLSQQNKDAKQESVHMWLILFAQFLNWILSSDIYVKADAQGLCISRFN